MLKFTSEIQSTDYLTSSLEASVEEAFNYEFSSEVSLSPTS